MKKELAGKKILFACVPTDGHFNPLTGLAKYLQDAGCDVRWYVSNVYAGKLKKLNIPHYPFVKALDINGSSLRELVPELKTDDPVKRSKLYQIHLFSERSVEYYEDISEIYQQFQFDLAVCDSVFTGIPFIRHKMHIPVIAIGVIPLAEDSADTPPYRSGMVPSTREIHAALYRKMLDTYQDSIAVFTSILQKNGIPFTTSHFMDILIKSADLYLQIGTPNFEFKRADMGSNVRFVGALMPYSGAGNREQWFDEKLKRYKKTVLVTQGTIETDVTKLLEPTLKAFQHTDVLVIVTTGGNGTEKLKEKYSADNVIITDFIPFNEVMPYANVYVTNGGYSGTILSLKNKLPMVAAGLHEGKSDICARIGYFKYGINLHTETPEPEDIYRAATEIMENAEYQNNVDGFYDDLESYDSLALCAGYITDLLKEYNYLSV